MIELTVKTLDSRNHFFSVPNDSTVKQLKEHIAESVNLAADSQRLIYCGRVLQDDKNLSEYDVNGKVIHLVQRAPPVSNSGGSESNAARTNTSSNPPRRNPTWRTIFQPGANSGNAMYLGAMAFPADLMDAQGISMPQPRQCLSQSRLAVANAMLRKASNTLNRLQNPASATTSSSSQDMSSSSDISPDPNANTNVGEEPLASSIALAAQAATAAAIAAAVSAARTSLSNMQEPQSSEGTASVETEPERTTADPDTTGLNSDATRTAGQQPSPSPEEAEQWLNENSNNNSTTGNRSRTPRTVALAVMLDRLNDVNTRLQPFLAQYHQLVQDDPVLQNWESQQRVFGGVSEIMHFLSHAYHALSDIMCDFSLPPPRYLRCRPVLIQHSAVLQTGIPIQAQINLTSNTNPSQSTTPASSASTTTTDTPTATSQPAAAAAAADDSTNNTTPQPPRPQAQQPAQGGRGLNLRSGIELFMDLTPGSITIDSLEATVVTNASAATTEASTLDAFPWGSPAPPPEFIQNLMQLLATQMMDGGNRATPTAATTASSTTTTTQSTSSTSAQSAVPGQNSQARGNTATHPTTSTQTRSTARPHVHLTPAMQSLGASNFDPFLPCNSHHIRNSRRRTSQQQSPSTNSQPQTQRLSSSPIQSGRSTASQESERLSNRRPTNRPDSPFQGLPSFHQIPISSIITAGNVDSSSNPPSQDAATATETTEGSNLPLSILAQLMQRITGGAAQPTSTLAEFLETLPEYSYVEGESIFMDIFMTLAQSFTFLDMMNLGLGRSECLIRARPQIRSLMSQRLLRNEPANENSINAVVARFNQELRPFFNILNTTRLREEVDINATITFYNTSMLPRILGALMLEEDENTYRSGLLRYCRLYVYELCAILQYCCLEGNVGMENIIRTFVCLMTNGVPAALQGWTVTSSLVNFRNFIRNLNVPIEHFRHFLVYRIANLGQVADSETQEPMETETVAVTENGIASAEGVVAVDAPVTVTEPPERISDVVWQGSLPADWVPIITRDSQRQRRQNSQPPFSDAYLSGMPSKRRKLVTSAKPPANLSHVISNSMASALGSAGMGSGPEVEVVAQRASQDPTMRSAYREQVRSTLRHNLQANPDFKPEKYPNAAKFFDTAK